jgi:hypothetical protein
VIEHVDDPEVAIRHIASTATTSCSGSRSSTAPTRRATSPRIRPAFPTASRTTCACRNTARCSKSTASPSRYSPSRTCPSWRR